MDELARSAYVMAQTACMLAELEAMKTANMQAVMMRQPTLPYDQGSFMALGARYGLEHNQVVSWMMEGK